MVFDFSNVKCIIKCVIDESVDYCLVIFCGYEGLFWDENELDSFCWVFIDGSEIVYCLFDEVVVWLLVEWVVFFVVVRLLECEL